MTEDVESSGAGSAQRCGRTKSAEQAELVDDLGRVPLFADLSAAQREEVATCGEVVTLPAGAVIAEQGDPADGFSVILDGVTEWSRRVGGQDVHAVTLGPGETFSELILLLDAPYPTTGRAVTALRLLRLPPRGFWTMLSTHPTVLRTLVRVAAERSQIHESVSMQQAKLIGLGSLAAGLAHELNNPVAVISRGTGTLSTGWAELSAHAVTTGAALSPGQRGQVAELVASLSERELTPLQQTHPEHGQDGRPGSHWVHVRECPARRVPAGPRGPLVSRRTTGVGVVGVGVISAEYVHTLQSAPDVEVRFLAARKADRARARAGELGVPASGTYDELLRDPSIEVVVNLTVPQVHAELTEQALEAGRHVYSEKPLALARADGRRLVDLAASRGLRLGCAPDTFLGTGLQTALRTIRSGEIGTPRSAFANFQYGGPNLWHPNPEFLFQAGGGPLLDIGPYHLTALVQVFGAVARVRAQATAGAATRVIAEGPRAGESFAVEVPTHVAALYEFDDGGVANVVLSFDSPIERVALEVTGTEGALRLPDPNQFTGDSDLFAPDGTSHVVPAGGPGGPARGTGVVDLVRSLRTGAPERASAALAQHVLDVMVATEEASRTAQSVVVSSRVEPAPLLPDAWTVSNPGENA